MDFPFPQTEEEIEESAIRTNAIANATDEIIQDYLSNSSDGNIDLKELAKEFKKIDGVVSAEPSPNGSAIIVKQTDGVYVNVIVEDRYDDTISDNPDLNLGVFRNINTKSSDFLMPNGKKALILAPNQDNFHDELDSLTASFEDAGFIVECYTNELADISKFRGDFLRRYDVILITSHGNADGMTTNGTAIQSYLVTGTEYIKSYPYESHFEDQVIAVVGKGAHYSVTPDILSSVEFDNNFVFLSACLSSDFAKAFLDHNAGIAIGFREKIAVDLACDYTWKMVHTMSNGVSFQSTHSYLKDFYKEYDKKTKRWSDFLEKYTQVHSKTESYFFVEPQPFDLSSEVDGNIVHFTWTTNTTYFNNEYSIHIGDQELSLGEMEGPVIKYDYEVTVPGDYSWYVVSTNFLDESYKSDVESFTISAAAAITTSQPVNVTTTSASVKVSYTTNAKVVEQGVIVGTNNNDPTNGSTGCRTFTSSSTTSPFTVSLSGLTPETVHYARGYVKVENGNQQEIFYGNTVSFTTSRDAKPQISVSPSTLRFDTVEAGDSGQKSITITNTGNADLKISSFSASGPFSVGISAPRTIKASGTLNVPVTYSPSSEGSHTGVLTISSNASNSSKVSVNLSGSATAPSQSIISLSNQSISLGTVKIGESSSYKMMIYNEGNADLKISSIRSSDPAVFSTDITSCTIPGNGRKEVSVTFTPKDVKQYKETLTIESNASNGTSKTVSLSGYGDEEAKAMITVDKENIYFGEIIVGTSVAASFTIANKGTAAANVSVSSPSAPVTSNISGNITLNAGASRTVTLTYSPKAKGSAGGRISIVSGSTTINVHYNGSAIEETVEDSNEYVDLGLSVRWAKCNLGASKPEGYGLYYQWGDTRGYGSDPSDGKFFWWSDENGNVTYKWCEGSEDTLTKYNTKSDYGVVDNKERIEMADDAARAALGGGWRIPTDDEWRELESYSNCTWTWTTINGVPGFKVQSRKEGYTDNWIFLPAAGLRGRNEYNEGGKVGVYWSANIRYRDPFCAYLIVFTYDDTYGDRFNMDDVERCAGLSIRPVLPF